MNLRELRDAIVASESHVHELADSGETDAANVESGRLSALRDQERALADDMSAELERIRDEHSVRVVDERPTSLGARILGPRDVFNGLVVGMMASAPRDVATTLAVPQVYDPTLAPVTMQPMNFLGTIPHGTTDGDEHFFLHPTFTNMAAGWTEGTTKAESEVEWPEASAALETIAHWIPIKKQTANRYPMLESLINGALLTGLDIKSDYLALRGSNSSGIVGIVNTTGILTHTKVATKNLKDTFMAMSRKVRVGSGYPAGYVCLSPYAIEELAEEKDTSGRYLFPDISAGGSIAGLTVVEDVNMSIAAHDAVTAKESALVYYAPAMSWDVADPQEVTVGLQNAQFVQNAYTLLGETTALLRVDMPSAVCYCGDLGITAEA